MIKSNELLTMKIVNLVDSRVELEILKNILLGTTQGIFFDKSVAQNWKEKTTINW